MSKVKKERFYIILSKNKYIYGAFPHTKEGREKAKKYLKKNSTKNNKLIIKLK